MANYPEIKTLVESSGNNFHYKVVDFLRGKGWYVSVAPYYTDSFTDKPREIDVLAEKELWAIDWAGAKQGVVLVQLFVECKYVNTDTVFWLDKKNHEATVEKIMNETGLEHPTRNKRIQDHHYLKKEDVAKLFASKNDKNQENEVFFKAISQSLNALTHFRNLRTNIPESRRLHGSVLRTLHYPLIICNSFENFYSTSQINNSTLVEKIESPFELEINYAYPSKTATVNEFFLIDVVSLPSLEEFLKEIEDTDVKVTGENAIDQLED